MTVPPPARAGTLRAAGLLGALVMAVLLGPLSGLLLVVARTGRGRIFALTALVIALGPLGVLLAGRRRSHAAARLALAGLVIVVGTASWLAGSAPRGDAPSSARTFHRYTGDAVFPRYALGNLLPEVDQLMLGFTLVPLVDPVLTQASASRLKAWTTETYAELEADPEFRALGSVLPLAYAELRGNAEVPLHSFAYIPAKLDRTKPAPVLVFFHGSGGNLKGYLWVLARVADRAGFVVLAPSFGLGNWRGAESARRLDAALAELVRILPVDPAAIHVAGLSNGGLAVSQMLAQQPRRFASAIFLSPVFDERAIAEIAGSSAIRDQQVLILTGKLDDRVPADYVGRQAARLRAAGARVDLQVVDDADHFLVFSHQPAVIDTLARWGHRSGASP